MTRPRITFIAVATLAMLLVTGWGVSQSWFLAHRDAQPPEHNRGPAGTERGAAPTLVGAPPSSVVTPPTPTADTSAVREPESRGALRVQVRDGNEQPLAGAEVVVRPHANDPHVPHVQKTDASGTAEFHEVRVGEAWVHARHQGYETAGSNQVIAEGQRARLTLTLQALLRAKGRVLRPDGSAAAGAQVDAFPGGSVEGTTELHLGEEPIATVHADAVGGFQVELPPRAILTLSASAPGFACGDASLRLTRPRENIVLQLQPAGRLHGTVWTPEREPCSLARVWVVPAGVPEFLGNPESVVAPGRGEMWWSVGPDEDPPRMSTTWQGEGPVHVPRRLRADRAGRFEAHSLPLGRYLVLADGIDHGRGASRELVVVDGQVQADVFLEPRTTLVVKLLGPDGAPNTPRAVFVLGAREHFLDPRSADPEQRAPMELRDQGAELAGLVGGTYDVMAEFEDAQPERVSVTLPASGRHEITIQGRSGLSLLGTVVDALGGVVGRAQVYLEIESTDGVLGQSVQGLTDAQGKFELRGLQDAVGRLTVNSDAFLAWEQKGVRAAGEQLRVVLVARPRLRFRLEPRDGEVLRDQVWVSEHVGADFRQRIATKDATGAYEYALQVEGENPTVVVHPWNAALIPLGRISLRAGESRDLGTFRIHDGGVGRGRVQDRQGRPVQDVRVSADVPGAPLEGEGLLRGALSAHTDAAGLFMLRGLHEGPVAWVATHAQFAPVSTLVSSSSAEVLLVLRVGATLRGQLRDAGDQPVDASKLHLHPLSTGLREIPIHAQGDATGSFHLQHVPAGRYMARLWGHALREIAEIELSDGEQRDVTWVVR